MKKLYILCRKILNPLVNRLRDNSDRQTYNVQRAMTAYDMVMQPDELYYREQYWHWLLPELIKRFPNNKGKVLDVGCGHGRLAIPLAAWLVRGTVTGIDITPSAIDLALKYCAKQGLSNVDFRAGDALEFVREQPEETFDMAIMTEVSFFMPAYREVIAQLRRVLRSGGILFVSFRSQYFDLLYSIRCKDWQSARLVRDAREGCWGGSATWFSWHTPEDVRNLLSAHGFGDIRLSGIGIASGIEGDPLEIIARPSMLCNDDQAQLMEIENSMAEQYAGCGRYILAISYKK